MPPAVLVVVHLKLIAHPALRMPYALQVARDLVNVQLDTSSILNGCANLVMQVV